MCFCQIIVIALATYTMVIVGANFSACVSLRLSGESRVECLMLTNVSANIAVSIFKVGMRWGEFWRPYTGLAVSGEINLMVLIGEAEEWALVVYGSGLCALLCNVQTSPQVSVYVRKASLD
jgi:hypothetical protein